MDLGRFLDWLGYRSVTTSRVLLRVRHVDFSEKTTYGFRELVHTQSHHRVYYSLR